MRTLLSIILLTAIVPACVAADTTPPPQVQKGIVTRVIDGDTFMAKIDRTTETIRLIGIDAPELHHPTKKVQCFGQEASQKLTSLLSNKTVTLVSEPLGSDRDTYAYTHFDFRYKASFTQYQQNAQDHNRGLWAKETCNGKRALR